MFREVSRRFNLRVVFVFATLLLLSPWTAAQVAGGFHGTITDPSGAPVSNAHISIKNLTTNNATALTTDARGFFSASDLPPGNYSVMASMPGFSDITASAEVTSGNQSVVKVGRAHGWTPVTVEIRKPSSALKKKTANIQEPLSDQR